MGDYYESALLRLRRVAAYLTLRYGDVVKTEKLTPVQFEVLLYVDSCSPTSVTDVAQFMVVDKSTSSRVLRGIEERGLIDISHDEGDRRKRSVVLTAKGVGIVSTYRKEWMTVEKDVRAKYDDAIEHLEST